MPEGVSTFVDENGDAHVSFLDVSKKAEGIAALLATGAPIVIDTSGPRRSYVVPEGNAREAGLVDESDDDSEPLSAPSGDEQPASGTSAPAKKAAPRKAPAKKAPAKKAAPAVKRAAPTGAQKKVAK